MLRLIHLTIGLLLLAGHATFLFRGLGMRRTGRSPRPIDRIARGISHWGLPAAIGSGLLLSRFPEAAEGAAGDGGPLSILHILLGFLPLLVIVLFTPFLSLRRRIPWLLPGLNLLILAAAVLTGMMQ